MATQALNVGYFIAGDVGSSAQNAHEQASGTVNNTGGAQPSAIQYFQSSGRGGGTYRYTRTFLNFDTSGITGTTGAVTLSIPGSTNADTKFTPQDISPSSARGSSVSIPGSTNADTNVTAVKSTHTTPILASGDDFNNIDVNTPYSSATSWSTSTNTITLNATAIAQIENENDFDVALLLEDDVNNTASPLEEDGDLSCGVNFGGTITINYTAAVVTPPYIFFNSGKYKIISGKIKI